MNKKILTLTIILGCVAVVAVFCGPESAWAVAGRCDNCHTMHYSEGGTSLVGGGPYNKLLVNDCLGCHTTSDSGDPFDDVTPFVAGDGLTDDDCLAGGFFPDTMGTGDHDDKHHGISASQQNLPVGYDGSFYTGETNGLGCAGSNGCHGNETDTDDLQALSGGHHNLPATYRMLYVGADPVVGSGALDYEEALITAADPESFSIDTEDAGQNVNIYSAGDSDVTISEFCAKCHSDFHDDVGSSGAWTRHPTDEDIPTAWAIGTSSYTLDGNDYKHNPVGYAGATFHATDGRRATCLSCHRAHGTANTDLLRWSYGTQIAGDGTEYGCLGCHNQQR